MGLCSCIIIQTKFGHMDWRVGEGFILNNVVLETVSAVPDLT